MMRRLSSLLAAAALAACHSAGGPGRSSPAERAEGHAAAPAGSTAGALTEAVPTYDAVPLIPRQVLFGDPSKLEPHLSPDGARLAYLAPDHGVLNVWVRTLGKGDDKVVTADRRGIRQYFWAPDGKHILYLQDQGGNEQWHVYMAPVGGGAAVDLTAGSKAQAQIVAIDPNVPGAILIALNDRNPQLHDVYRVDLATGKRQLAARNDISAIGWFADRRLRVRAAQVISADGAGKLMVRDSDRAKWRELQTWGFDDMWGTNPIGFGAGDHTVYLQSSIGSNASELRAVDTRSGKETTIVSDPDADVTNLVMEPLTHAAVAVAIERDRREWKVVDPRWADDFAAMSKTAADGDILSVDMDRGGQRVVFGVMQDDGPIRYYAYDRASKKSTFLFSHRPELDKVALAERKPVTYQARDGLTIHAYLTLPHRVAPRKLPAVLFPHGGPWDRDRWGYDSIAQWLANRGYAVLQPNFRGSTGYGKKFLNAATREWGGAMQDDLTDATRWLIGQGIADPKRIALLGASYGGYATLMGLAKEPDLYVAGVELFGVANLTTWMKTIPPYWTPFLPDLYRRVGDPEKDAAFLRSRSPVFLADRIRAPLLISAGANDPRVPRTESLQIRDALKKAGKEVEYIEFPDEGHGFQRPENRLRFFAAAESFLARHVPGGRAEPLRAGPASARRSAAPPEQGHQAGHGSGGH